MRQAIYETFLWTVVSIMSLAACKKQPEDTQLIRALPSPDRFNRARFPCTDSVRGVWRVYTYNLFRQGDQYPSSQPSSLMTVCFTTDTMWFYGKDTLLYKHYAQIERLTPAYRQPYGYFERFTYRINPSQDYDPTHLQGYYARFRADSLFLFGSYDDGNDFWLVRDCR